MQLRVGPEHGACVHMHRTARGKREAGHGRVSTRESTKGGDERSTRAGHKVERKDAANIVELV